MAISVQSSKTKKRKRSPAPSSSRTSLGNPQRYLDAAKGGITTSKKYKHVLGLIKSKGGTVLWLKRGSNYMRELGRKGGLAKAANLKGP